MNTYMFDDKNQPNFPEVEVLLNNPEIRFTPELREISEIDSRRYPVIHNDVHDEIQYAMTILENQAYQPKEFCIAESHDRNSVFQVESDRFDWLVTPVRADNYEQIPYEYLEGIGMLLKNKVNISGIALAKPKLKEEVSGVIHQEIVSELKALSKIAGFCLLLIASAFKSAAGNTNVVTESVQSPKLLEIADPVLLVRINDAWLEIGRW